MPTYTCTGCGAQITQEQYQAGLTHCGKEGCSLFGQPFTVMQPQNVITKTTETTTQTVAHTPNAEVKSDEDDIIINNA